MFYVGYTFVFVSTSEHLPLISQVELVELDIKERPSPSSQKMTNHCCAGMHTLEITYSTCFGLQKF